MLTCIMRLPLQDKLLVRVKTANAETEHLKDFDYGMESIHSVDALASMHSARSVFDNCMGLAVVLVTRLQV